MTTPNNTQQKAIKGRGATHNLPGRFSTQTVEADNPLPDDTTRNPMTCYEVDSARSLISYNQSPDVPFDRSINPYRGCEHGCIYCFARPSHSYLDLSPGLDFETRIFYKQNAAQLLEKELNAPGYQCRPIALGVNTDAYQPLEKSRGDTRALLKTLLHYKHPVTLITKSALILRDLDLLQALAEQQLVSVAISLTTLDDRLKARLEPRTANAAKRLKVIAALTAAQVPVTALVAPVIPAINEHELEDLLSAGHQAGATHASYVLLRLPHELKPLFEAWLHEHFPDRARHVLSLLKQSRSGNLYQSDFHQRMSGQGTLAELLAQRFRLQCKKLGLNTVPHVHLTTELFRGANSEARQMDLF